MSDLFLDRGARMEFEGLCRMICWRVWDRALPLAGWLGCNPSTMDGEKDDPTGRRITHFSRAAGCGGWYLANVWPLRTPYPADLWAMLAAGQLTDEMRDQNIVTVADVTRITSVHFAAFGVEPARRDRAAVEAAIEAFTLGGVRQLVALGTNPAGWPLHPLARGKFAIPNDRKPQPWAMPA